MRSGSAFVFINTEQALRFGHVGWGFALNETEYYFGSTDHLYRHKWWDLPGWLRYAKVDPNVDNDWWSAISSRDAMLHTMSQGDPSRYHIRYHIMKEIGVENACPEKARQHAEFLRVNGWEVSSNNCVHQAYEVLKNYGAELPNPGKPLTNIVPKVWFARIAGAEYKI